MDTNHIEVTATAEEMVRQFAQDFPREYEVASLRLANAKLGAQLAEARRQLNSEVIRGVLDRVDHHRVEVGADG